MSPLAFSVLWRITKGKKIKAARALETEQKMESKKRKLETFKVTDLMKDWLGLLYLTGAAQHGALSNSR